MRVDVYHIHENGERETYDLGALLQAYLDDDEAAILQQKGRVELRDHESGDRVIFVPAGTSLDQIK